MAANEAAAAPSTNDWRHDAIEAGILDPSHPYVGLNAEETAKLAASAFGERPLLIQLRTAQGDWRIVQDAKWLVAWCAAADPVPVEGSHGLRYGPADLRAVYPIEHAGGPAPL